MTAQNDLDRTLRSWFHADATATPPPEPLTRAIEATRNLRPRPALVAWIGSARIGAGKRNGVRDGIAALRPAFVIALIALLVLALAGGAALVGSRLLTSLPFPVRHVYQDELVSAPDLPSPMGAPLLVTLLDGHVLVMSTSRLPNTSLLYDPSTGVSVPAGPMVSPDRQVGSAIRLQDGRVFVTGDGVSQVFDPTTLQFAPVGPMVTPRSWPELAMLPDGRVLVAGGVRPDGSPLQSVELFDPGTLSFSPTGPMPYGGGPMGLLPDGRVFVASSPNTQIYDPRSGTFAYAGVVLPGGVTGATALPDGRVVIVGVTGFQSGGYVGAWDPAEHTYGEVWGGSGSHPLWTATTLDDGRVLVIGGRPSAWAGVLDPATGQMAAVTAPPDGRPSSTRLLDGRVLIVGGLGDGVGPAVQVFQ